MIRYFSAVCCLFFVFQAIGQGNEIVLSKGLVIKQSCTVKSGDYILNGAPTDIFQNGGRQCQPVIIIEGDNTEVDFRQTKLIGAADRKRPDLFYGVGVLVRGKNITIRNLRVSGYKVALLAENAPGLKLLDCDFSYNYRPRLFSDREHEAFSDWLSYHHNESDEWLRYGAGIYLNNCDSAEVKNCKITGNQNALLMTGCENGMVWNNTFQFNSGLGIGLYRCSNNKVMHNKLDWNVRGYSDGFYERGQDSAGILAFEQCSDNTFAYNSATHSGDGFFLWAGQSTMDTGEGGCNNNMIFGNDFSYAPTNGVEVTFSKNEIRGNLIRECTYGIWGGYSYETVIAGNLIQGCKTGVAIEHGQQNTVRQNLLMSDTTGVYFWANATQSSDWGYAKKHDTRSRDGVIDRNVFLNVRKPLKISASENMAVNGENLFAGFEKLLQTPKPNPKFSFIRNDIYGPPQVLAEVWQQPELKDIKNLNFSHEGFPEDPYAALEVPVRELYEPDSLKGGMLAALPAAFPQGRQFILIDEWGPYDFRRPMATLDTINGNLLALTLLGPSGDWKVKSMTGVKSISNAKGEVPSVLIVERDPAATYVQVQFEYSGPEGIATVFGEKIPPGDKYLFDFHYFDPKINWKVNFYNFDSTQMVRSKTEGFTAIKTTTPLHTINTSDLWFGWWGKPAPAVPEDHFATFSEGIFKATPGTYAINLTSDDGVRLYVDGKKLIDRWDIHEPVTDRIELLMGGNHTFQIEHFEAEGFSTLNFRLERVK
jgi:parallel beta-helix repeat protein